MEGSRRKSHSGGAKGGLKNLDFEVAKTYISSSTFYISVSEAASFVF